VELSRREILIRQIFAVYLDIDVDVDGDGDVDALL